LLAIWLTTHLVLGSITCASCPCVILPGEDLARPATLIPRAYRTADVVFAGRVMRVDTLATRTVHLSAESATRALVIADTIRYEVAVGEIWKGAVGRNVPVLVSAASSDCGVDLAVGESYLVYAYERARVLSVDACARVTPLSDASVDQQQLGPGRRPR
jgi:hypothetical protein